jgi:hypothetical protein
MLYHRMYQHLNTALSYHTLIMMMMMMMKMMMTMTMMIMIIIMIVTKNILRATCL